MQFELAKRIKDLPPYLFAGIDKKITEARKKGVDIISLGIGDPDQPTPKFIVKALAEAAKDPATHQYPSYQGSMDFREAAGDFMARRFGVTMDPASEIITLIGSKEGIAHFPLAFINPGDLAICCSPGYPVGKTAVGFAGGEVYEAKLSKSSKWLPDLRKIPDDVAAKAKLIYLCYPSNPTGATATQEFFSELVSWAHKTRTIIMTDCAYSEIYYDDGEKPLSIFETPGAKEVAIEFHSLSKTFNMTGWRIGWAAGNEQLIAGLGKVKTNVDSGAFNAIQKAGAIALRSDFKSVEKLRRMYKRRRNAAFHGLKKIGAKAARPKAGFFVWAEVPDGFNDDDAAFADFCIEKAGVVVTPGSGFGDAGKGYFRIALTVEIERMDEAFSRIEKALAAKK